MNKKQRTKFVINMYLQGRTRPEIARATHFNFTTIKKIIDEYESSKSDKPKSLRSQAFALFDRKNSCKSVAYILDIPPDEVERYFEEWSRLDDVDGLHTIFLETKGQLRPILDFYYELKIRNFDIENLDLAMMYIKLYPTIKEQYDNTLISLKIIEDKIRTKKVALSFFQYCEYNWRRRFSALETLSRSHQQAIDQEPPDRRNQETYLAPAQSLPKSHISYPQVVATFIHTGQSFFSQNRSLFDPDTVAIMNSISNDRELLNFLNSFYGRIAPYERNSD